MSLLYAPDTGMGASPELTRIRVDLECSALGGISGSDRTLAAETFPAARLETLSE